MVKRVGLGFSSVNIRIDRDYMKLFAIWRFDVECGLSILLRHVSQHEPLPLCGVGE